jgi:hypothetical protein
LTPLEFRLRKNTIPSDAAHGLGSQIRPLLCVASIGTVMRAIGTCLAAIAIIFSLSPAAPPQGRVDGVRMPEAEVEDFEMRLIYP